MNNATKILIGVLAVTWLPWLLMSGYLFTAPLWGCDPNFKGPTNCIIGNLDLNYFSSSIALFWVLGTVSLLPIGAVALLIWLVYSVLNK